MFVCLFCIGFVIPRGQDCSNSLFQLLFKLLFIDYFLASFYFSIFVFPLIYFCLFLLLVFFSLFTPLLPLYFPPFMSSGLTASTMMGIKLEVKGEETR